MKNSIIITNRHETTFDPDKRIEPKLWFDDESDITTIHDYIARHDDWHNNEVILDLDDRVSVISTLHLCEMLKAVQQEYPGRVTISCSLRYMKTLIKGNMYDRVKPVLGSLE